MSFGLRALEIGDQPPIRCSSSVTIVVIVVSDIILIQRCTVSQPMSADMITNTRDAQALLGYSDRYIRCNDCPLTSVIRDMQQ